MKRPRSIPTCSFQHSGPDFAPVLFCPSMSTYLETLRDMFRPVSGVGVGVGARGLEEEWVEGGGIRLTKARISRLGTG